MIAGSEDGGRGSKPRGVVASGSWLKQEQVFPESPQKAHSPTDLLTLAL